MIFNSVTFLFFLVITVCCYWVLPDKQRLWLVFLSSLTFYGFWRVEFVSILIISTVVDYLVSLRLPLAKEPSKKKGLLAISLTVNLGLLFYFKYLAFFSENVFGMFHLFGADIKFPALNIILPLGISFYTFQTISYTVDVYRGFIEPEKDFVLYGCYVTFFPQLVAGPILRAVEIIPQLRFRPKFDFNNIGIGIKRIIYGLFLKVVLADNLAPIVDSGFVQATGALSAIDVWTLAFLFGFQIYFDFSAYSHIAIGAAGLMGLKFPENFNFPYFAVSPKDFWRRWHISLSSWIRDYLYLPLVGATVLDRSSGGLGKEVEGHNEKKSTNYALFLTWAIMGLWHGASWTFVLWGLYHAIVIYLYRILAPRLSVLPNRIYSLGGWFFTLLLSMFGWIPFRATTLATTLSMWGKMFSPGEYFWLGLRENTYLIAALIMFGMLCTYFLKNQFVPLIKRKPWVYFATASTTYTLMIGLVFIFLRPINQFIYFQF